MKREILFPIWDNDNRTAIRCKFNYPEKGIENTVVVNRGTLGNESEDWKAIMAAFSKKKIDENTKEYEEERQKRVELQDQRDRVKHEANKTRALFEMKAEAFKIPEVKNSKDKELRKRLRKSTNILEIQAITAVLMMRGLDERNTDSGDG